MSETFARLIALVRSGLGFQTGIESLREGEREVWALACQHKVASILCPAILESDAEAAWKEEVRRYWQLAALREKYYVRKAEEISDVLRRRGVRSFVLKGVELARSVYPKPGMRAFRDVDLLVSPQNLEVTDEVLRAEGFVQLSPSGPLSRAPRVRGNVIEAVRNGLDALSYEREDLFLEIHTSILPPNLGSYPLSHAFEIGKGVSAEDFFVHLCFHTTRHHFLHALRQLSDIALWCRVKKPNFAQVSESLQKYGVHNMAYPAWALAHEIFPETVAKPVDVTSRVAGLYTRRVRAKLEKMPLLAISLSGSPLPFLAFQKRLFRGIRGSSAHRNYQLGDGAGFFKRTSWNFSRPFQLFHRHAPILKSWLSFTLR